MGLFSTHTYRSKTVTNNIPYEKTIHEYRAPTDKSIVLYDEYLEKTKAAVLGVYKIKTSLVEIVTVAFSNNYAPSSDRQGIRYYSKFSLNGIEHTVEFEIDGFKIRELKKSGRYEQLLIEEIVERVSKRITISMLRNLKIEDLGINRKY